MKSVLSLIFVSWSLSQAYSQEAPWYEQALVGIETGPTGAQFGSDVADLGYVARFQGKECIEKAAAAHGTSLSPNCHCGGRSGCDCGSCCDSSSCGAFDADGTSPERGLREYVGPNAKIADLPELAVVSLGRLQAVDVHSR